MVRARQKHALRAHVMPGGEWLPLCATLYLGCLAALFGLMCTLIMAVGHAWDSEMRILWASAVRDPCPGSVWTWQPLCLRGRACLRVRERVPCRATAVVFVAHFAWPSHGKISGVLLTQAMILGVLDMSDVRYLRGITRSSRINRLKITIPPHQQ
jgi:hypothetical protein